MYGFHTSTKAISDCKYISTLGTGRWCSFYVNYNVTHYDIRVRKVVVTYGTDNSLIFFFFTPNETTFRGSLLTLWTGE